MNMWGLELDIFNILEEGFEKFLNEVSDYHKGEYLIPTVMNELVQNNIKVKVLDASAKWLGVTYREDLPGVKAELAKLQHLYK